MELSPVLQTRKQIQELSNWPRDTDQPAGLPTYKNFPRYHTILLMVQAAGVLSSVVFYLQNTTTTKSQHYFLTSILKTGYITKATEIMGKE